ncbi:MAG TPA: 3'(2'),5'-bisphosphate nucleotidase CysQ [Caulobacteraceae bacterium]
MTDDRALDRGALLAALVDLAVTAGAVVWEHFSGECAVEVKRDASPVTAADRAAEAVILAGLRTLAPGVPVVAEEEAEAGRVPPVSRRFFLVDPLDGTKEFIRRGTDFTVNIGLIEDGAPTLGVVYAPARSSLWWGDVARGEAWTAEQTPGAERGAARPIRVSPVADPLRAMASKSHNTAPTEAWLAAAKVGRRVSVGSSLKFVLVASGEADVYPRPAPTMEWDTAAGDAVLRAAGGRTFDLDGNVLGYGKAGFFNPGFVATGPYDPAPLRQFLTAAD